VSVLKFEIRLIVESALERAVQEGKIPGGDLPEVKIEYPKEDRFGDYSTPFALESARSIKKNPLQTGEILKEYIQESPLIDSVEVVKPGFINMFVSRDHLMDFVPDIIEQNDRYGRTIKDSPLRYNIEFVSANPTGPLNIVSARAAALGDTLANILEAAGDTVDREFYVNDYGNQVRLLGLSVYYRYRQLQGESVELPEECYQGDYVKDIAAQIADSGDFNPSSFESEDAIIEFLSSRAIDHNLGEQQRVMKLFGVDYKQWFRESTLHEAGKVMEAEQLLESKGAIYQEEGKKIFRATDFGDDKDRVVVRDDGRPTYLMADIAYHCDKFNRGYDHMIDIWGPDHHGYIARLSGSVAAMGYDADKFKVLIAQQVNLIMDGEPVKMSKRLGRFSTMQDLVDDIGVDVARYFFVMRSMESHLDFDLDLAKRESSENPVFYLQYAYARICSIFREADKRGVEFMPVKPEVDHIDNDEALILLKLLAKFPEEVIDSARTLEPHRIATYLMRLAQGFHKFYSVNRVLGDDSGVTASRLSICQATRIALANGLKLLGVSAPEKM
jgi:arginyl-tRNA synthetase